MPITKHYSEGIPFWYNSTTNISSWEPPNFGIGSSQLPILKKWNVDDTNSLSKYIQKIPSSIYNNLIFTNCEDIDTFYFRGKYYSKHHFVKLLIFVLLIVGIIVVLNQMFGILTNPNLTTYDASDETDVKNKRQLQRGTAASIISSITFAGVNFAFDKFGGVDASTSTAFIGMLFGNTVGFLFDNSIGSDDGWKLIKTENFINSWKYSTGSLVTSKYIRYLLTVLLDLFISIILFTPTYEIVKKLPFFRCGNESVANFIVSMFLGMITFQTYTNATRFKWAYPSTGMGTQSLIKGSTMQLCISIASIVFITAKTGTEGIHNIKIKLLIVFIAFCILTALSQYQQLNSKDVTPTESSNTPPSVTSDTQTTEESVTTQEDDVISRSKRNAWKGALALIILGLCCSSITLMTSSKSKFRKIQIFIGFMVFTLLLCVPSVIS